MAARRSIQFSKAGPTAGKVHLIVFIHGYQGTAHDFDNAEQLFLSYARSAAPLESIYVLKPTGNSGLGGTYDGIEKGAIRIWREVMDAVHTIGDELEAISLIGHSLGGLYARYVARLLDDCFIFEKIQPRFFVTLASPHLSVRRPPSGPINIIFQRVAPLVSKTVQELCLEDDAALPILYRMTDETFLSVLRKFKRRLLYANVSNDFQVHYSTASISTHSPYSKDPKKSTRSLNYPDMTDWSLQSVHHRKKHDIMAIDEFAKSDERARHLRAMFLRLNDLEWERYDAVFLTVFAHEQIINKRSLFSGKHVMRHLVEIIVSESQVRNSSDLVHQQLSPM